ncbi:hypothetical protein, partial [Plesiomonas sp.]
CGFNGSSRTYPDESKYINNNVLIVAAGDLMEINFRESGSLLRPEPYVVLPAELTNFWQQRIKQLPKRKYNIGISWRSGLRNQSRNLGLLDVMDMLPLFELDANIISLQYDDVNKERKQLQKRGKDLIVFADLDQKNDFMGVAALYQSLDFVISVGTSVGDIAYAAGVPAIMLYANYIGQEEGVLYENFSGWGRQYYLFSPLNKNKNTVIQQCVQNLLINKFEH